ncbi:MAG: phosphatase PAP2 family protein [Clostridia bacterium]|nr:phosphatase PAP2 family protein [Clostridia bacterium]
MNLFKKRLLLFAALLAAFLLWTASLFFVDVQPIGPLGSRVGFASINRFVHSLTGVNMTLYTITDWLGLVPIGICACFAALGLSQWLRRRSLKKVDRNLFVLGGFYVLVMTAYALFEVVIVNRRPVLIGGILEASYPSSTTMLVLCVIPTAVMQLGERIRRRAVRIVLTSMLTAFLVFMVAGRLLSGVHWFSDIIGGMLLSAGLVALYRAFSS